MTHQLCIVIMVGVTVTWVLWCYHLHSRCKTECKQRETLNKEICDARVRMLKDQGVLNEDGSAKL
jgi:hypothetical protein